MHLHDARRLGHQIGNDRALEGASGDNHIGGLDPPLRGFGDKAGAICASCQAKHLDPFSDRGIDLPGIGHEIVGNRLLAGKAVGVDALELQVGEAVMPGRTVCNQRIPAFRPPAFRNPVPFDNQMLHALPAQMVAHCDTGLPAADDQRFNLFDRHGGILPVACSAGQMAWTIPSV